VDLISAILLLIIVTDPLGNLPMVITCLKDVKRKRKFILREVFFAMIVLLLFLFFGRILLDWFGISEESLRLAGGIILFIIAIKMIFPSGASWVGVKRGEEPFLFPLAVPLVAGPSAVATVTLFAAQYPEKMTTWIIAICISMITSLVVFLMAEKLRSFMGDRGLSAMQRLMGMLLTAIAVEMLVSGVFDLVRAYSAQG